MPNRKRNLRNNKKSVQPRIDCKPPIVKLALFLKPTNLGRDKAIVKTIYKENCELIEKINKIQRTTGIVNDHNPNSCLMRSRIPIMEKQLKVISRNNFDFGRRLLNVKAVLETRWPKRKPAEEPVVRVPRPLTRDELNMFVLHPKVFLDFEVKNNRPLGRIVIELFTMVLPRFVLNFVKCCSQGETSTIKFERVFPKLFIQGLLTTNTDIADDLQFGGRRCLELKHDAPGVLSVDPKAVDPQQFTITFKPISILNGKRIAFGKIVKGLDILAAIQEYGTKNGIPKHDIGLSGMGVIS